MTNNSQNVALVLFCYKRLYTLKKLINSLQKCPESSSIDLVIFSDGFRNEFDKEEVLDVRRYLREITGFKSIKVNERPFNFNIERNIVDGLDEVFARYDYAIVLEDDGEVASNFLTYMLSAFEFYRYDERVMHIGTFTFLKCESSSDEVFFWRYCENTAGGWGTWRSAWRHFIYENKWDRLVEIYPDAELWLNEVGGDLFSKSFEKDFVPWDICWLLAVVSRGGVSVQTPFSLIKNNGIFNGSHFDWKNLFFEGFVYRARFKSGLSLKLVPFEHRNDVAERHLRGTFQKLANNAVRRSKLRKQIARFLSGLGVKL